MDAPRDTDLVHRRRRAILIAGGLLIAAAIVGGGIWRTRSRPPQAGLRAVARQNVLLITIDTLRADAISSYGGPRDAGARSPRRHRRALRLRARARGAHAAVARQHPHRRYPYQHGVRENSGYRVAPARRRSRRC